MRRPSPLPPPAAGARPAASPPADSPDAPIIPLAAAFAPASDRPGDASAAHVDTLTGLAPADAGAPADADVGAPERAGLGVRDVWRAARARRRALRAEVRRFTARQRRRRMLWIGVAGAAVLLVAGTVGSAYSPLFAVQRIEVVGTTQLDASAVGAALDAQLGTPLPLVDSSAVKAALIAFPLVESYTLEARPPHDLVVRIVERTPVGVLESTAGFTLVDAAGVALATTPTPPSGQPVMEVSGGTGSAAFRAAGSVMRALPDSIRPQVTGVTATSADDVTLSLGATGTTIVWGSADRSAEKANNLETMMVGRPIDTVSGYDVSSPDAIVVW